MPTMRFPKEKEPLLMDGFVSVVHADCLLHPLKTIRYACRSSCHKPRLLCVTRSRRTTEEISWWAHSLIILSDRRSRPIYSPQILPPYAVPQTRIDISIGAVETNHRAEMIGSSLEQVTPTRDSAAITLGPIFWIRRNTNFSFAKSGPQL